MAIVEFRNVDIIFGKNPGPALELLDQGLERQEILEKTGHVLGAANASIAIEEGEICVLMGLSGSGKSTLLRAVNGLNKVSRGQVLVKDGDTQVDVASCDAATLRHLRTSRVAMVFQQFALLPWRTVEENVGLGLELRGMSRAERTEIVRDKLKLVGLDEWRDKHAHELSGGMQQRVGLARAFATDADILLMDEPFSALDPLIRSRLQDELLELQRELKKTIIFVSHDLDEAMKIGNHIAIMESGRIVQYGEPEEIVLAPANRYVADFVAHMNPLNVLTGISLMTPIDKIETVEGWLNLDWSGRNHLKIDANGTSESVKLDGSPGKIMNWTPELDLASEGECGDTVFMAPPDILMRTVIDIRHASGRPVVLVEGGRMIGVVGDDEIYEGMLRQTRMAEAIGAAE